MPLDLLYSSLPPEFCILFAELCLMLQLLRNRLVQNGSPNCINLCLIYLFFYMHVYKSAEQIFARAKTASQDFGCRFDI